MTETLEPVANEVDQQQLAERQELSGAVLADRAVVGTIR
jgi:hypothetical protein